MANITPQNPYPFTVSFVDQPGINIPGVYASTSSMQLPPKVSTPATERIGIARTMVTASHTAFSLTGSDGAVLGFGGRVGAVTVFGTDLNPGSDTQAVDSRANGERRSSHKGRTLCLVYSPTAS